MKGRFYMKGREEETTKKKVFQEGEKTVSRSPEYALKNLKSTKQQKIFFSSFSA